MVTVRSILDAAMSIHGMLSIIYGCVALAHPTALEPFHKTPSKEHLHWFQMHGLTLLAVGVVALYTAAFVKDRVHTYWVGAALWLWTGATGYYTYYDYISGGNSTSNLVAILAVLMAVYAFAFILLAALPGAPVTSHAGSHINHHERQAVHEAKHSHKND